MLEGHRGCLFQGQLKLGHQLKSVFWQGLKISAKCQQHMEDKSSSRAFLVLTVRSHYYLPTLKTKQNQTQPFGWYLLWKQKQFPSSTGGGLSNSRTRDTVDVCSPITLTHAEIQNLSTMLPEGCYYEYHFLLKKRGICYYSYLREKLAVLKRIKFYLQLTSHFPYLFLCIHLNNQTRKPLRL